MGRFGRPTRNAFPLFRLLSPNRPLRRTENPRVDGSIPSLATISNSMIRNGFRVSPADYREEGGSGSPAKPDRQQPQAVRCRRADRARRAVGQRCRYGRWAQELHGYPRERVGSLRRHRHDTDSVRCRPRAHVAIFSPSSSRTTTLSRSSIAQHSRHGTCRSLRYSQGGSEIESNSRRRLDLAISADCSSCRLRPHHAHARWTAGTLREKTTKDAVGRRTRTSDYSN